MSQGNEAGRQNSRPGARNDARVIEVDIPSDVQYIEKVVELVQRECALMRFGARQLMLNLAVALTEALSNAILRGNNDDPGKHVHVMARVDPGQLVIEVQDEGEGFDLDVQQRAVGSQRRTGSRRQRHQHHAVLINRLRQRRRLFHIREKIA